MINTISIALSGLNAATNKLNATASNIANITTAGSLDDPSKAPYDALTTNQTASENGGVNSEVVSAGRPFVPTFAPDSPFANSEGLIGSPNVNLTKEAVNLSLAEITYKANIGTLKTAEEMSDELLNIFDEDA